MISPLTYFVVCVGWWWKLETNSDPLLKSIDKEIMLGWEQCAVEAVLLSGQGLVTVCGAGVTYIQPPAATLPPCRGLWPLHSLGWPAGTGDGDTRDSLWTLGCLVILKVVSAALVMNYLPLIVQQQLAPVSSPRPPDCPASAPPAHQPLMCNNNWGFTQKRFAHFID